MSVSVKDLAFGRMVACAAVLVWASMLLGVTVAGTEDELMGRLADLVIVKGYKGVVFNKICRALGTPIQGDSCRVYNGPYDDNGETHSVNVQYQSLWRTKVEELAQEPDRKLLDDGSCPKGQIKEINGEHQECIEKD